MKLPNPFKRKRRPSPPPNRLGWVAKPSVEQHLVMEEGASAFAIEASPGPGKVLEWRSTDTSVARLEVSPDTRTARVIPVGVGRAIVSVSDQETCVRRVVTVGPRPRGEATPIDLKIRADVDAVTQGLTD